MLDRLRGVMRVGCSGLCGNQPASLLACARAIDGVEMRRDIDFHTGSGARSRSPRWRRMATRAAAALLAQQLAAGDVPVLQQRLDRPRSSL